MQISKDGHDGSCAHRRMSQEVSAEDEETKFRSEAAKLRVERFVGESS